VDIGQPLCNVSSIGTAIFTREDSGKPYKSFGDLGSSPDYEQTGYTDVPQLPQAEPEKRSPRLRMTEFTPVVVRCPDGHRISARLHCVSLTGGLITPASLLAPGILVNLLFVTPKGPVTGRAEMLHPVSWTEQPFRFVAIPASDQRRLYATIQPAARPGM